MQSSGRIVRTRLRSIMDHASRYSFKSQARLAADAGISKSVLSRLLAGKSRPSYAVVEALTEALEKSLHHPLDPRDVVTCRKSFRTKFVCQAVGCVGGCLPDDAYEEDGSRAKEWAHLKPGQWEGDEFTRKGAA